MSTPTPTPTSASTLLELPHTKGCLVCDPKNRDGMKLSLFVDPASGIVTVDFAPRAEHIGFTGIAHGGMLATVVDEAMVWAATWAQKRFCLCGELSIRYRMPVGVGETLRLEAKVALLRPKLLTTVATLRTPAGGIVAAAEGKYVPMDKGQHDRVVGTFIDSESTQPAANLLKG